jgi:hypothetical protein
MLTPRCAGLRPCHTAAMRSTDSVETLRGSGKIFRDGVLVLERARYVVHLSTPREAGAESDALRLEGVMMSDVPFELLRQPIELELEDGRRWLCRLEGTSGDLVDRGGLQAVTG